MTEYKICPNCDKKLSGIMTTRYITEQKTTDFINTFHEPKSDAYCNECSGNLIVQYRSDLATKKQEITEYLMNHIDIVPIVTSHNPTDWIYKTINIVSSQSISGTGFISEISGSWADLTGGQSNTMGNKVTSGEDICKNKLRLECLKIGGNAILATDIDYSEVGGAKAMLMVCMSGTAVELDSNSTAFNGNKETIENLKLKAKELDRLSKIKFNQS